LSGVRASWFSCAAARVHTITERPQIIVTARCGALAFMVIRRFYASKGRPQSSVGGGASCRVAAPGGETFAEKSENGAPILANQLQPCERSHLGEIDSAETHARDENVYATAEGFVLD